MGDQRVYQTLSIHKALVLPFYKVIHARPLETHSDTPEKRELVTIYRLLFLLKRHNLVGLGSRAFIFRNVISHRKLKKKSFTKYLL